MASAIFLAASFGVAVQAMALDSYIARPTDGAVPSPVQEFPSRITVPPSALELAKRQDTQTVLVGPDNVCGYISGRAGAAYSCNALTATCAFVTTSDVGAVACCNEDDCGLRFGCLDYDQIMSSSACDYGCFQDTFTVKCTSTAYPYCGTVSFFDGVVDYYCDSLNGSIVQKAETTFSGQTDDRSFTPVAVTLETDTNTSARPSRTSTGNDEDEDSASNSPGTSSTPTNSSTPAPPSGGGSSSNTGAIVGGVVGGVGGIAVIGLVAWLLIRRRNKNKPVQQPIQQPPQQPGYPPMQQQGPGPHPGHQSVYNPVYGPPPQQQQYGGQPNQPASPQYPPGYYQDQNKPPGFVSMAAVPAAGAQVPDRNDSTSPVSQSQDNRVSMQPSSPTSTVHSNYPPSQYGQPQPPQQQQQQQGHPSGVPPTVHEASSNVVGQNNWNDNHHGQYHELQS